MAKIKMRYGIDLGTTNSAICKMEHGDTIIIKSTNQKDTCPSCVQFKQNKRIEVGDTAYQQLPNDRKKMLVDGKQNIFVEFKRTMGQDKSYESSNMGRGYNSEELSAEVLKKLKSFVGDEMIDAAVITIPAKFKAPAVAATERAAKMAGIHHCSLLQEPLAACYAYGLKTDNKNGYWLVFDFGGGTFDVALVNVEQGIINVVDTDGDEFLGGKNLDYAIVDNIILPQLQQQYKIESTRDSVRESLKPKAEQAKNQLSSMMSYDLETDELGQWGNDDNGDEIELYMEITRDMIEPVLKPLFQQSIDITLSLLKRNNLKGNDLASLILIGGPTYSPVLRQMLKEQVTSNVDTSIDPMTAVARGAALFATTQEYDIDTKATNDEQSVAIELKYESTSVQPIEYVIVKLLPNECKGINGKNLSFEIVSGDGSWSSGKVALTSSGDAAECPLKEGRANAFVVNVYDETGNKLPCFPNELTIIQGCQPGSATLPYNIGIEAYDNLQERTVFVALKGLEKNQSLPAVGVRNGLKVPRALNPGNEQDFIRIPIYQGEYNSEGSSAIYNDHVFDVVITGDDVPALVPQNSEIDITLKVNNSQGYHIEVLFVSLGESFEKDITIESRTVIAYNDWLHQFSEAKEKLRRMKRVSSINASEFAEAEKMLTDLEHRKEEECNKDDDREHLLADLRRVFLKLENIEKQHEWDTVEAELREEYNRLEKANNDFGHKFDNHVQEMHRMVDEAIRSHNVKTAREVKHDCHALWIEAAMPGLLAAYVDYYNRNFGRMQWRNRDQARQLLDHAQNLMNNNAEVDEVRQVVIKLIDLLPPGVMNSVDLPQIGG